MPYALLLAATVLSDATENQAIIDLPSGGQVELVAISDGDGHWWEADGQQLAPPRFEIEPRYSMNADVSEKRPIELLPNAEGEIQRVYVIRLLDVWDPIVARLSAKTTHRDPAAGTNDETIIGTSHRVLDANGKPLENWFAAKQIFPANIKPVGLQVAVQHGEWKPVRTISPDISDKLAPLSDGNITYAATYIPIDATHGKMNLFYKDRSRSQAARFRLYFDDGTEQTTIGGTSVFGETYGFQQKILRTTDEAATCTRVEVDVRPVDTIMFADVAELPSAE